MYNIELDRINHFNEFGGELSLEAIESLPFLARCGGCGETIVCRQLLDEPCRYCGHTSEEEINKTGAVSWI